MIRPRSPWTRWARQDPPPDANPDATAACRHCRRPIRYAVGWTGYWFHPASQSVYCDPGGQLRAEP